MPVELVRGGHTNETECGTTSDFFEKARESVSARVQFWGPSRFPQRCKRTGRAS